MRFASTPSAGQIAVPQCGTVPYDGTPATAYRPEGAMSRVQAIERAFLVLGVLADGPLGVTEIAERTRLPKSTAARLPAALSSEGVVEQLAGDSRYRLGARLAALAGSARATRGLVAVAHPQLADLAKLTGEAAGLGVRDGST